MYDLRDLQALAEYNLGHSAGRKAPESSANDPAEGVMVHCTGAGIGLTP